MKRARSNQRGYTVVEVLSAMTLFAIGAAGVISMQRVTILGGDDARRMDVATNIAHEWTARLQRDSMYWTKPNSTDTATSNLTSDTTWLANVSTSPNTWITPAAADPTSDPGKSGSFDLFGRDRPTGSSDHIFCTQYRLKWITDPGDPAIGPGASMLAEVRVFWARLDNAPILECGSLTVPPDQTAGPDARTYYHFVYAATVIRPNPLQ